jgi:hypothetical protein
MWMAAGVGSAGGANRVLSHLWGSEGLRVRGPGFPPGPASGPTVARVGPNALAMEGRW